MVHQEIPRRSCAVTAKKFTQKCNKCIVVALLVKTNAGMMFLLLASKTLYVFRLPRVVFRNSAFPPVHPVNIILSHAMICVRGFYFPVILFLFPYRITELSPG